MSAERFFIADPYNDDHIKLIADFEEKNGINSVTSMALNNISQTKTKEDYIKEKKESNEINQILFLEEENHITDLCHIQAEKDMKLCRVFFTPITIMGRNRKIVSLVTDYVFDVLGMEDVFITVPAGEADRVLIENLESKGFENLGEDNGNITYLKEKELAKANEKGNALAA